jgi:ABC-type transport system substrate-binding protein
MATTGGSAAAATTIDYDATAKVAIYDTFSGWCFANNLANSALMAGRTIYETLFEKTTTNDLAGLLAVKGEPVAGSGLKVWKVTLRTGIKFHDGTDFNAGAVVSNFQYGSAGDGSLPTTYWGATFAEFQRLGEIMKTNPTLAAGGSGATLVTAKQSTGFAKTYAKEMASKDATRMALAGLAATVTAASKAASVSALSYMASTAVAFSSNILTAVATKGATGNEVTYFLDHAQNDFLGTTYASGRSFQRAPSQFTDGASDCVSSAVGTGPFQLARNADWSTNKLKVVRNDNYWRKDALGGKLPYLKEITFENVKEVAQRANAVVKGTYDAAMFGSGDGKFNQTLRKNKAKVTEIKSANEYYPSLWLNQGKPGSPFANKNARLAVMTCIDRANFLKVRNAGEGKVAKSLVGPSNIMYSTSGFSDKLQLKKSQAFVAAYKKDTGAKALKFTIPSDVSSSSIANIEFLKAQWKKCGITAVRKTSEAADIIAKAFNASPDKDAGEYYNAYDAIIILLMEGSDATFNMPFVLTNAYSTGTPDPDKTFKDALGVNRTKGTGRAWGIGLIDQLGPVNGTPLAVLSGYKSVIFGGSLGTVLSLNHHPDTKVDDLFYAAQAEADPAVAKTKFAAATAYLQSTGTMTSLVHGYYNMFYNKAKGLQGFGALTLPNETDTAAGLSSTGTTKQRQISNWGVDWTGVYKTKK